MDNTSKKINITGTNNKYEMKKLIQKSEDKEVKKRISSENWNFSNQHFEYEKQLKMIIDISNNSFNYIDDVTKIAIQEINKNVKIGIFCPTLFLTGGSYLNFREKFFNAPAAFFDDTSNPPKLFS